MFIPSSPIDELQEKNKKEISSNYTYISTYNMGNIGIKKIIEENHSKPLTNIDSKNNNITTNNTNTNTNSNTNNNNTSKNRNIQTSKKKTKINYSVSPNVIRIPSSPSPKYYKKSNQRLNMIKKKNLKSSLTQIKFGKKNFYKSTYNFYIYTNNNNNSNCLSKLNIKYHSKSKKKSNSTNKLIKERKISENKIKSNINIFSLINNKKPSSKNRSNPNLINTESKINLHKTEISGLYSKKSNFSFTNINIKSNIDKLIINENIEKNKNKNPHNDKNKEINSKPNSFINNTQNNENIYLRVRKRADLQKISDNMILNSESSTPVSNCKTNKININIPTLASSCLILKEKNFISNNEPKTPETNINNNLYSDITSSNKLYLSQEKIKKDNNINNKKNKNNNNDKLNNSNNSNKTNKTNNSITKSNYNKDSINDDIRNPKINNNNNNIINISNTNTNNKNYKPKIIEITKSNLNENAFTQLKNKNNNNKNISNLKEIKTEGNTYNKTRNNKYYSSSSKNKYKNKTRKNYSLNKNKNSKNNISQNSNKYKPIIMQSNRYRSNDSKKKFFEKKNKIGMGMNKKIYNIDKKKEQSPKKNENEFDFDCPEEMHFFMVNLTNNYKKLINNNF